MKLAALGAAVGEALRLLGDDKHIFAADMLARYEAASDVAIVVPDGATTTATAATSDAIDTANISTAGSVTIDSASESQTRDSDLTKELDQDKEVSEPLSSGGMRRGTVGGTGSSEVGDEEGKYLGELKSSASSNMIECKAEYKRLFLGKPACTAKSIILGGL